MGKRESSWLLLLLVGLALLIFLYLGGYLKIPTGEGKGELGIALTIIYADGTSKTIDPFKSSVLPLAVVDTSGKQISRVDYNIQMRVTWSGTEKSHSVTGSVWIQVNGVGKGTYSITNPSTLENGVLTTIKTGSISASDLDSWGSPTSVNTLNIGADVDVTVTFTTALGDRQDTRHGEGYSSFQYAIKPEGITGLQVVVNASPVS
jgi:hypothetical protein